MSGGIDGTSYICYAAFNDLDDDRNVNVNRNDNDWNDDWWVAGVRKSLHFLNTSYFGGICFSVCPSHPPSIRPISSNLVEMSIYFFVSIDLVSQSICNSNFRVSSLRMARRRYGGLSDLGRKAAADIASIVSIHNMSILTPKL